VLGCGICKVKGGDVVSRGCLKSTYMSRERAKEEVGFIYIYI